MGDQPRPSAAGCAVGLQGCTQAQTKREAGPILFKIAHSEPMKLSLASVAKWPSPWESSNGWAPIPSEICRKRKAATRGAGRHAVHELKERCAWPNPTRIKS